MRAFKNRPEGDWQEPVQFRKEAARSKISFGGAGLNQRRRQHLAHRPTRHFLSPRRPPPPARRPAPAAGRVRVTRLPHRPWQLPAQFLLGFCFVFRFNKSGNLKRKARLPGRCCCSWCWDSFFFVSFVSIDSVWRWVGWAHRNFHSHLFLFLFLSLSLS